MALHAQVTLPAEKIRTMVAYGAFERRSGHLTRARYLLRDAIMLAGEIGAPGLGKAWHTGTTDRRGPPPAGAATRRANPPGGADRPASHPRVQQR
jgi:hypothetical protein